MKKNSKETISIIGLGYVGLPLLVEFSKKSNVIGIDNDKEKIKSLKLGKSYISDIPNEKIRKLKNCIFTFDLSEVKKSSTIIICLPTPLLRNKNPNLKIVTNALKSLIKYLNKNHLIIIESTTYPRTTKDIIKPLLNKSNFVIGESLFLAFSPERINPGSNIKITNIPKIVGADDDISLAKAKAVYKKIFKKILLTKDTSYAEAAKLTENIFRSVNIALVNELKIIYDKMGIDIWEVVKLSSSKPFGFMPFYPGPGLGGHCIPIDPLYLTWQAKNYGLETKFIELSANINQKMPLYVVKKTLINLKIHHPKISKNKYKILLFGVAYKKDVNDLRESPALEIMKILKKKNIYFDFYDPLINKIDDMRHYPEFKGIESINLNKISLKKYHGIILLTDHTKFNYNKLFNNYSLIIDTRNKLNNYKSDKIVKS